MRSLAMSACFALALFAAAQIPPMEEYKCVFQQPCGPVSQACWGTGHKWGQSYCTYCDANTVEDLCQRAEGGACEYNDVNQSCGTRRQGVCVGTGAIGTCRPPATPPTIPEEGACSVPMCMPDPSDCHDQSFEPLEAAA